MSEITVLKQIEEGTFKQRVLTKLLNSESVLLLKDKFDRHLPLKVVRQDKDKFFCKGAVKMQFDFSYSGHYTAHFKIDSEKYLLEAIPHMEANQVVLTLKRVFHLQARKTVRYKVPQDTHINLTINAYNEEDCLMTCPVTDLNSLGCSIISETLPHLKVNDLIDCTLVNLGHESFKLQGIIRNVRPHGPEQFAVGIEFHHMMYCSEDKLISMIGELHKSSHLKAS